MRFSRLVSIGALAATIALPGLLLGQEAPSPAPSTARKWTVDDVLALKVVADVAMSPDGKRVAYVVTTADREANANKSDIWVVPTDGGAPVQVTHGPRVDRAPQWSPDGSWLAFLSDRGEKKTMQVYGIDPAGGEAWPITKHEASIESFQLSPNGQRIAFIASAPATKAEQDLEKERGRPVVRDSAYSTEWSRLWTAPMKDRAAGDTKVGSPDGMNVAAIQWGPDSRAIAWSAKPSPNIRADELRVVYVQSEPGAEARRVASIPGGATLIAWPNDLGLIVSGPGKARTNEADRLWLVSPTGTAPVALTDSLDEDATYVAASSKELLVSADVRTGRALFRIPLTNGRAAGPPQRLTDEAHYYNGFSVSRNGGMVAFIAETSNQPPDVHASSLTAFAPRRLTTINPQAAQFAHGERRVVSWRSKADSESIEGVLTLPVGYQQGTKVPLLVVVHGGPTGVTSNRYPASRSAYPIAVFTSLGYAVLQPNFRGSSGYGSRFRRLNIGDIPGKDWIDVNSGVDAVIRMGIADSTKLGLMGWSYGGFQTYWGITHTTRFAAASAGAGAVDLTAFYSQTDVSDYLSTLLGAAPWENYDLYAAHSAYRSVKDVATPLLIQVGGADTRVSKAQSIQFYEALKGIGKVPVKLVEYPNQEHSIAEPRLVRDLMMRNVQWFTYWVPVTGNKPPMRVASGN